MSLQEEKDRAFYRSWAMLQKICIIAFQYYLENGLIRALDISAIEVLAVTQGFFKSLSDVENDGIIDLVVEIGGDHFLKMELEDITMEIQDREFGSPFDKKENSDL